MWPEIELQKKLFPQLPCYQFVASQIFFIDDAIEGDYPYRNGEMFCRDMDGNWYIYSKSGFPIHYPHDALFRLGRRFDPLVLHKDHWKPFALAKEELKEYQLVVFKHSKVEILERRKYEDVRS